MMMPTLRRAVSAAAAAAVLSIPAAAQSDAAFAAALGRLPSALATMAQLKTAPQAPAAAKAKGPAVPAAAWKKLLGKVRAQGTFSGSGAVILQSLNAMRGPQKDDHTTYSVTISLSPNADGALVVQEAAIGVTEFALMEDSDIFTATQWTFVLSASGEVTQAMSADALGNYEIGFRSGRPRDLDLADSEVKTRVEEAVAFWTAP
jgi:hypothetical protein